jgi:hypothetical protein
MASSNLSLIHPEYRNQFYGGIAATTLLVGALFTRYETVKIVAMTTLSTQLATSIIYFGDDLQQKYYG